MNNRTGASRSTSAPLRLLLLLTVISCAYKGFAQVPEPSDGAQSNRPNGPVEPLPPDVVNGQSSQPIDNASGPQAGGSSLSQPDNHALSGGEIFGLEPLHNLDRIFDPALQASQSAQTGMIAGQILSVTSLGGSLDLARRWRRYRLALVYSGAETVYQPSYFGTRYFPYHRGGLSQDIFLNRWTLRLRDDLLYSLGSGFSGLFTGGPPQVGQNGILNSIQPSLVPSETIETGLVRQLNNTALGEADYELSRRSTVTILGSYGFLHFLNAGYIDDSDVHGRFGYSYALSAKNNIAVTYDYDRMKFAGTNSLIQTDLAQIVFGRKLTGRLAFQAAAGPELVHLANFGAVKNTQVSWSALSTMSYELRRNSYALSYSHATTAGSGVFVGSQTDTMMALASRQITNFWSASLTGGYAVNRNLVPVATLANRFDNWYAGASLNRQIGRQVRLALNYEYTEQRSAGTGCPVINCGLPGSTSQIGMTVQWHPVSAR